MATTELTVPDIGDFHDIPVIEVLVSPGETIAKDAPLVTLESEKATMEVPAAAGGVVRDVRVKIGDRVSQGSVLATLEAAETADATPVTPPSTPLNDAVGVVAEIAGADEESRASSTPDTESVVDLTVPDIGNFTDVPVIELLVAPGQSIEKDAALVTLESEKATMEIPSTAAGVVRDVKVKVGDRVSQGTVLASITPSAREAPAPRQAPAAREAVPAAREAAPRDAVRPSPSTPGGTPPVAPAPAQPAAGGNGKPAAPPPARVHASPAIRRFARDLGADLSRVNGTGPNGRVTREDVQRYVKRSLEAAPAATNGAGTAAGAASVPGLQLPAWPSVDFARFGPVERVALSRIQRISGPALARNWVMIPHVTQNDEADVTELEAFRKQINAERGDVKVTMLAFLVKASLAALRRYPQVNASLDGEELVLKRYYNIGFAADTPAGLVVPVIRDVDKKGILEIARDAAELAAKARDGKLGPGDMSGATFSISSLGSIGGTSFTPIVNAPEVAILGAAKAEMKPVWDGEQFVPRLVQPLSFSYDHRVIDGALAARFTVEVKHALTDLRRTLL